MDQKKTENANVVSIDKKSERRTLPNKAFDMEYHTERWREVQFLAERGIQYSFVKKTRDYGISQYKYKKTPALFAALVEFYSMLEAEKNVNNRKNRKPDKSNIIPFRKDQTTADDTPADSSAMTADPSNIVYIGVSDDKVSFESKQDAISPEKIKEAEEIIRKAAEQGLLDQAEPDSEIVSVDIVCDAPADDTE